VEFYAEDRLGSGKGSIRGFPKLGNIEKMKERF